MFTNQQITVSVAQRPAVPCVRNASVEYARGQPGKRGAVCGAVGRCAIVGNCARRKPQPRGPLARVGEDGRRRGRGMRESSVVVVTAVQ